MLPKELLEHLDSPVPVVAGVQAPFTLPPDSHIAVLDLDASVSASMYPSVYHHIILDIFRYLGVGI